MTVKKYVYENVESVSRLLVHISATSWLLLISVFFFLWLVECKRSTSIYFCSVCAGYCLYLYSIYKDYWLFETVHWHYKIRLDKAGFMKRHYTIH